MKTMWRDFHDIEGTFSPAIGDFLIELEIRLICESLKDPAIKGFISRRDSNFDAGEFSEKFSQKSENSCSCKQRFLSLDIHLIMTL